MDFVEVFPSGAPFSCLGRAAVQAVRGGQGCAPPGVCAATPGEGTGMGKGVTAEPTVPACQVPLGLGTGAGSQH